MKKTISLLLSAVCVFLFSSLCVFAEGEKTDDDVKKLTVFGDSISAGYKLSDYVSSDVYRSKKCFSNIIAEKLHAEPNKDYFNFSFPGWTSSQILNSVKNTNPEIVRDSDYILISAGANEIMDIMEETVYDIWNEDPDVFQKYSGALNKLGTSSLLAMLTSEPDDPEIKEFLEFFIGKCTSEESLTKYRTAVELYEKNIKEMVSYIRSTDSQARIIFIPPYNPVAVVKDNKIVNMLQDILSDMRDRTLAFSESIKDGSVQAINLLDSFDGRYPLVTFILQGDIHPNETGHGIIADLISKKLVSDGESNNNSAEEISSAESKSESGSDASSEEKSFRDKDAPVNNTLVYVFVGIAALLAVIIVIHFIITHKRK